MNQKQHRAVVNMVEDAQTPHVTWALACMRTGVLLGQPGVAQPSEQIENLAATLPEVFGTVDPGWLERVAAQLETDGVGPPVGEVLLLSDQHVHVIQPLTKHPGLALLAVSSAANAVGLVLSRVHAQLAVLEREE